MAVTIFANKNFMTELLDASADAITNNPSSKSISATHDALNDLKDLYSADQSQRNIENILPTEQRNAILTRLERSAKTGYTLAMFVAGLCWNYGFGRMQNPKGDHFINVAAEWDCAMALNYLGIKNFRIAPKIAVEYFQRAAKLGYNLGYKNLGLCNLHAIGVPQNIAVAIKCFQAAGNEAKAEIAIVREHIRQQLARVEQFKHEQQPADSNVVVLEQPAAKIIGSASRPSII